jgi:uncharacterized protein (UPF0335 family)
MSDTVAAGQLRAFVERIERIEADIKEMNADKSEVYKELRGVGFDVKAVRQCVAARKLDSSELQERNAVFDMYWDALGGSSSLPDYEPRARAREASKMDRADDGSFETGIVAAGNRLEANPAGPVAGEVSHAGAGESPATIPEPFEPPAFLQKDRQPVVLRPHCLNPSECAGYGSHTCHACLKAVGQVEVAA